MDEVRVGQCVNMCRVCCFGFEDYEIKPVLKEVECVNCGDKAELFNGIVLQDNGENMFDVYGEILNCSSCGKEPSVEFIKCGSETSSDYFSFSCGHEETEIESEELIAQSKDLDLCRTRWNCLNNVSN